MTFNTDIDYLADLDRASEAAMRGDLRDAERWTMLAERKLAMARKLLRTAIECGFDKDMKAAMRSAFMEGLRAAPKLPETQAAAPADAGE